MYVLYLASYRTLPAWGVALLTSFTPFYVAGLEDLLARRLRPRHFAAAALAVGGAAVVIGRGSADGWGWMGVVLLQGSNLCFAAGQVAFRRLAGPRGAAAPEAGLLAWMYLGAAALTALLWAARAAAVGEAGWPPLAASGWAVLLYLGAGPTALGFYLWNKGAARTGAGVLAAANNLKVPLGVAVSWLVFGENADYLRAVLGLAVILAALRLAGGGSCAGPGGEPRPVDIAGPRPHG